MAEEKIVSIVLPIYNEKSENLEVFIQSLLRELKSYSSEILFVDDGSGPEFKKEYERFRKIPEIQIIAHLKNRGQFEALKTGLLHAKGEFIFSIDADGEYPADNLIPMINELKLGKQLVSGRRISRPGYSIVKKMGSMLVNVLFRILNPEYSLKDLLCPVSGIQRKFWEKISSSPFLFRHLKLHFLFHTRNIAEVPISYRLLTSKKSNYSLWNGFILFAAMVKEILRFNLLMKNSPNIRI